MTEIFPLPILPPGSLANSVITTVWVGMLVVGFFNLRLGWVLSGLVVPGYLVPLLIAKPWSAVAVTLEGVVTYLLVWFYSERLMRWSGLAGFFGRDRFFAMVLVSILVRILFDGWLFPILGEWANELFRIQFDYRTNFHSFGLIVVSLIANQFWKTGLVRGMIPFLTTVGLTWAIVRFGLMELTNFSISNLSYMYEDAAASMLASPKSYIILITSALIASRMNLLYGWDFNGILIPSLLALQWYQPEKILVSVVEALVILGMGILVLRLPRYHGVTMEGARKLMLFFNISFAWKIVLGFLLVRLFPHVKVTDYFGFGYMLPTLMAVKMHDKEIIARLTRATLQVSLVAVAGATVVGFALTFVTLPLSWSVVHPPANAAPPATPPSPETALVEVMRAEKLALYDQSREKISYSPPLPAEADLFVEGIRLLKQYVASPSQPLLEKAEATFAPLNYHLRKVEEQHLLLLEGRPRRGWGSYLLSLQPSSPLVVAVPAPLEEWGSLEAGVWLLQQSGGRALMMAGAGRKAQADGTADVLINRQTPFHLFHREMSGSGAVVQVRTLAGENLRALTGQRTDPEGKIGQFRVRHSLPTGLDLTALKEQVPDLSFHWDPSPMVNVQREESQGGFAELFLSRMALRGILLKVMQSGSLPRQMVEERRIDGYLQAWLFSAKEMVAPRGSDLYQPPGMGDLLYWDVEVITPLIRISREAYQNREWSAAGLEELRVIGAAASRFGYEVVRYHHRGSGRDFLLVSENGDFPKRRFWGTYVIRLGEAEEIMVQAPRPLYEGTSFEFAVHLFESLDARWLLIGGTHPDANRDGSADLIRARSPHHLFNLVNQVILRENGEVPMLVTQIRASSLRPGRPPPEADLLVAFHNGIRTPEALPPLGHTLFKRLEKEGLKVRFVDGAPETTGYEVGLMPQARYLEASANDTFAVLWLAPEARRGYRQQGENRSQETSLSALGVESSQGDLITTLLAAPPGDVDKLPTELRHALFLFQEHGDLLPMHRAMDGHPDFKLKRLLDFNTAQSFLLVEDAKGSLLLVLNLDPRQEERILSFPGSSPEETARDFLGLRAAALEFRPGETP